MNSTQVIFASRKKLKIHTVKFDLAFFDSDFNYLILASDPTYRHYLSPAD